VTSLPPDEVTITEVPPDKVRVSAYYDENGSLSSVEISLNQDGITHHDIERIFRFLFDPTATQRSRAELERLEQTRVMHRTTHLVNGQPVDWSRRP